MLPRNKKLRGVARTKRARKWWLWRVLAHMLRIKNKTSGGNKFHKQPCRCDASIRNQVTRRKASGKWQTTCGTAHEKNAGRPWRMNQWQQDIGTERGEAASTREAGDNMANQRDLQQRHKRRKMTVAIYTSTNNDLPATATAT